VAEVTLSIALQLLILANTVVVAVLSFRAQRRADEAARHAAAARDLLASRFDDLHHIDGAMK
jgi:hypothetical protein